ncbi:MAG: TA system VapC family ribonuclease toxin [Mycobacteriales bacterium]
MILVAVNLLLYAVVTGFPQHAKARTWWESALNGATEVGLAAPAVFGFLRLATNPRVLTSPLAVADAVDYVRQWLARPHVHFLVPGPKHLEIALGLLQDLGTAGNLTTDVQLAALAIEHQAVVHSVDSDFARFPQVRQVNLLR